VLASLDAGTTARLAEALRRRDFPAGARILEQGAPCVTRETDDAFFIIVDGEAVVTVDDGEAVETNAFPNGTNVVNRLFRGDFFGESAVDDGAARAATVTAAGPGDLRCLALDRENLVKLLGPLRSVMREEKAPQNVQRRMAALKGETPTRAATFEIRAGLEPGAEPGASASGDRRARVVFGLDLRRFGGWRRRTKSCPLGRHAAWRRRERHGASGGPGG
jgi:uncharacterized cupin superfamily protein